MGKKRKETWLCGQCLLTIFFREETISLKIKKNIKDQIYITKVQIKSSEKHWKRKEMQRGKYMEKAQD